MAGPKRNSGASNLGGSGTTSDGCHRRDWGGGAGVRNRIQSDFEGHRNPCLGRSQRAGNWGESETGCRPLSGARRHSPSPSIVPSPARTSGSVPWDARAGYVTLPGHRSDPIRSGLFSSLSPQGGAWVGIPADAHCVTVGGAAPGGNCFFPCPNGESRS